MMELKQALELIDENNYDEICEIVSFEEALDYCIKGQRISNVVNLLNYKFRDNPQLLEKVIETMYEEIDEMQKRQEFGFNYNGYR